MKRYPLKTLPSENNICRHIIPFIDAIRFLMSNSNIDLRKGLFVFCFAFLYVFLMVDYERCRSPTSTYIEQHRRYAWKSARISERDRKREKEKCSEERDVKTWLTDNAILPAATIL